ncbi:MAG: Rrf2 family transcriptional regulator [Desulfovibrio sp.]|nr:Rrf2 family transcriptional regulator [Desulfovibrio sp.]MDY5486122.1 Rrf2 family transcriptional regulator [Desulfovibrio sp.]
MKFSTRVSDAVHILAFIALNRNEALTSQRIAESIRTNPGCVRQLMVSLRRYGIMTSVQGHARPALSRAPADISLLDIYRAVEGGKPLLHLDTHTNPECGVGVNIQLALQDYFDKVQNRAEDEMSRITLQDVLDRYEEKLRLLPSGNAPARKGHMAAEKPRISQTESGQAEGRP